ncbi:MAG: 4'-phosphopantetheinyl transferase superfamily protein [Clostridia bacterium]|nr:4'-phosphopantetheinyl transferase superfamily protein [Clostridia bacterium]
MTSCRLIIAEKDVDKELSAKLLKEALETRFGKDAVPEITRSPSGKPGFADTKHGYFSVSHTGRFFLVCFSTEPVGADIEIVRKMPHARIAGRFFSSAERRRLAGAGDPGLEFFRIWTKKEALVKLSGEGLSALGRADSAFASVRDISDTLTRLAGTRLAGAVAPGGQIEFEED